MRAETQQEKKSGSARTRARHPSPSSNLASSPAHALHVLHQTIGNRAVGRLIQAKLKVNQPGDQFEQEADCVAEQVMRTPDSAVQQASVSGSNRDATGPGRESEKKGLVKGETESVSDNTLSVPDNLLNLGPGQSLDRNTLAFVERRFGRDFSDVRVHADANAAESARAVNALAYTSGRNIVFASGEYSPTTNDGRRLLVHELAHVVQQRHAAEPDVVRRLIRPADVGKELVGQHFTLRKEFTQGALTIPAGDTVTVTRWSNADATVEVSHPAVIGTLNIPKHLLRPSQPKVAGIAPYGVGLEYIEKKVERGAAELEEFEKTGEQYKSPKAQRFFAKELGERQAMQARREEALNIRLIQASMFNRFDPGIEHWVTYYNKHFGFEGGDALDPNLIKAMAYQETEIGTSSKFMFDPPRILIMSRFNVLQAVDSWPVEQLLVIHETMDTLIAKYHLGNIEKDLIKVETEF